MPVRLPRLWYLLTIATFAMCVLALALLRQESFNGVELNVAMMPASQWPFAIVALVLGLALALFAPGYMFTERTQDPLERLPQAVLLTVIGHTVVLSAAKLAGVELTRSWLLISCAALWILSSVAPRTQLRHRIPTRELMTAGLVVTAVLVMLGSRLFLEDFAGDGTEHFEYARSLKTRILPYWDFENGFWGYHHRFFAFAYFSLPSLLAIGEIEAAVRLPGIVFAGLTTLLVVAFVDRERRSAATVLVPIGVGVVVLVLFSANYGTWDPYISDLAEPTTTDLLATYLVLCCLHSLRRTEHRWAVAYGVIACVTVQVGAPALAAVLGTFVFSDRRYWKPAAAIVLTYAAVIVGYELQPAPFAHSSTIYSVSYILDYWLVPPEPLGVALRSMLLLFMTGGVIALAVPLMMPKDREATLVWIAGGLYAAVFILSSRVNPHYFIPAAVLFLAAFARALSVSPHAVRWSAMATAGCLASLLVTQPRGRENRNTARQLASMVSIDTSGYEAKVDIAQHMYSAFPFSEFGVGHHTLVHYANRQPCGDCSYVLSRKESLDGYEVVSQRAGVRVQHRRGDSIAVAPDRDSYCPGFLRELYTAHRRRLVRSHADTPGTPWLICLD